METASWREMLPTVVSATRKDWNFLNGGQRRTMDLPAVIDQARLSGNQGSGVGGAMGWESQVRLERWGMWTSWSVFRTLRAWLGRG